MNPLNALLDRLRVLQLDRALGLRPPYPPVAIQVDSETLSLVRLKPRRRGPSLLYAVHVMELDAPCVPVSIFQARPIAIDELAQRLRMLFERTGTRPGRISLVLPDNLAKVTLLGLPERPASARQLEELVRSQMRRAVPFRLEDSALSYQMLPGEGSAVSLLVTLMRRSVIEQFERALEAAGARVGLVDLCTTNLLNLCRPRINELTRGGEDVALVNCDRNFFSMAIVRNERLIFLRCKTFALGSGDAGRSNGALLREISNSFSYYQEKLKGQGVGTVLVRSVGQPAGEVAERLAPLGLERVEIIDAAAWVTRGEGQPLAPEQAQQVAPALGAATGRGQ